jgi:c-di-GMP-related signal transduction protein
MDVFIARQAILDRNERLFAYELLYRACRQNYADVTDESASTLQVLSTTLLSSGFPVLCGNTPVFINFGREMLKTHWPSLFPSSSVVIEILESVQADPDVIAACAALKRQGYTLALDDVTEEADPEFLKLADIIKVDFRSTSPESQARLAHTHRRAGRRILAEKVETLEEFERARSLGFDYFQGFFFSRPVVLQGHHVPAMKGSAIKLLMELQCDQLDFPRLESLIKCDVSLTYKLLRYVNSALFTRASPISGVREALVVLGEVDIRRWIVLATLLDLSGDTSRVLASHALVRARFCETLAIAATSPAPSNAFLVGMFSLLDALAHRPLPELLKELKLPADIAEALLLPESNSDRAAILRLAKSYETGQWDRVADQARRLALPEDLIPDLYVSAVDWAGRMIGAAGAASADPDHNRPGGSSGGHDRASGQDLRAIERALGSGVPGKGRVFRR